MKDGVKGVNLRTIAAIADVNVSTVSRALNGSERVKPETRENIVKIAQNLQYRPNHLARSLVTRKTKTIGVVVPEVSNSFYAGVLMSIEQVLSQYGYSMILGLSHYDAKLGKDCIDLFLSKKVDGLISFSDFFTQDLQMDWNVPAVLVDFTKGIEDVDLVASDNDYGVKLAVDYLFSLGHRRIAFVTDTVTTDARLKAFKFYMNQAGLDCVEEYIICTGIKYEQGGYESIERLMKLDVKPTAVFCANDYMAIGALKALEEAGLSVPGDISVVGFDDSTLLNFLIHSVTTVHQPKHLLGDTAARLLMKRIQEYENGNIQKEKEKIVVRPELVIRNSTGICKT